MELRVHMVSHTGEMPYKVRLGLSPGIPPAEPFTWGAIRHLPHSSCQGACLPCLSTSPPGSLLDPCFFPWRTGLASSGQLRALPCAILHTRSGSSQYHLTGHVLPWVPSSVPGTVRD
uniref:Uncharacterized protein n=1 Tax=Colobus angolensis palliatus TaxID=336983 RepID=A0A2K5I158_COLAP